MRNMLVYLYRYSWYNQISDAPTPLDSRDNCIIPRPKTDTHYNNNQNHNDDYDDDEHDDDDRNDDYNYCFSNSIQNAMNVGNVATRARERVRREKERGRGRQ